MNNTSKTILLASLLILPWLGATNNFGYEHIKVLFFILSITLIGFSWMGKQVEWTLTGKAAAFFILILLTTSLTGINPKISLLGNQPYFQGWVLYAYLFLFYLIVKSIKIDLKEYATSLSASAMLVAFLAIKDWVTLNIANIPVSTYAGRVVSTFGQPNFYAGFLLLTLPFAYLLLKNSDQRLQKLGWGSGLFSMIGIMVSYSRSAIILSLMLLSLGLLMQLTIKFRLGLTVVGMVIILAALKFSSGTYGFLWNEFLHPLSTNNPDLTKVSIEKRVYIWPQVFKIGYTNPISGYGLENIQASYANYFLINKHLFFEENLNTSLIGLKDLNLDRTHNYILDLFLFSGVLGVMLWLIFIFLLIRGTKNKVLLAGLITYLIWIQFQNQSVVHLVYFWLLAGLIDREH